MMGSGERGVSICFTALATLVATAETDHGADITHAIAMAREPQF